jgi:hypothetical protein
MDLLSLEKMQDCVNHTWNTSGSDNLITSCLWELGHAFLDPGLMAVNRHSILHVVFVSREQMD